MGQHKSKQASHQAVEPRPPVCRLDDIAGVIDQDAATVELGEIGEHIQDHPRPHILVFQVRSVDQNLLAQTLRLLDAVADLPLFTL